MLRKNAKMFRSTPYYLPDTSYLIPHQNKIK